MPFIQKVLRKRRNAVLEMLKTLALRGRRMPVIQVINNFGELLCELRSVLASIHICLEVMAPMIPAAFGVVVVPLLVVDGHSHFRRITVV
jgi:hypothetical protein